MCKTRVREKEAKLIKPLTVTLVGEMGSLREAIELAVTDGRKAPEELPRIQRLWEEVFCRVETEKVRKAVMDWLMAHPKGWPRVGELQEMIKLSSPTPQSPGGDDWSVQKRLDLSWAVSILERPERFQEENYRHTLESAQSCCEKYGYREWQKAKSWLSPGWAPARVEDVYL